MARAPRRLGVFSHVLEAHDAHEAAARIRAYGLEAVNIHRQRPDDLLDAPITADRCRRIRDAYLDQGLEIAGFAGYRNLIHPDPARREEGLARLEDWMRWLPDLGADLIATEGGTRDPDDPWAWHPDNAGPEAWRMLVEAVRWLAARAEDLGARLGVEIFASTALNSVERALDLLAEVDSPALGIVFDPANLLTPASAGRCNEVIEAALRALGPHIVLAHAKDYAPPGQGEWSEAPSGTLAALPGAGKGVIDFARYFRGLAEVGYTGPVIMEHLREDEIPATRELLLRCRDGQEATGGRVD